MLSFCHEMLSLKNLVSAIVTCTCRDFVGRARACEKDTKRSENSRRECYRIAVSDRLIRDEARIRNLIHADRPRIRINPFAPKSPLLNFDRLSPLRLAFIFALQRLPSNSVQFSDISLSIPLSRNLYPGLGHVNRTVSSYYIVSSSGRRHPGRRVGLVRLVVIPTVGGMHRIIPESAPVLIFDSVFHVVSPRLVEEGRNFRYIGEIR